jgi:hypothetical protein
MLKGTLVENHRGRDNLGDMRRGLLAHLLTYLLTYLLIYLLTHSLTYSLHVAGYSSKS